MSGGLSLHFQLTHIVAYKYNKVTNFKFGNVFGSICGCVLKLIFASFLLDKQSTLVISNSLISNSRLSRSENLVLVLTQRSTNRQQNCSSFPQYFQYISHFGVKLKIQSVKGGCSINCFPQFRKSDISKYGYLEVLHRVPWISR